MSVLRGIAFATVALSVLAAVESASPGDAAAQYFRFGKNKVQYAEHEWFQIRSEHFNVYFYQGGQHLADFTAKAAEEAYWHASRLFQYRMSGRTPLIVYLNHADFAVTNAVNLPINTQGIGGVTELSKNRIALPFTGDFGSYRRVVHHELVHAMINDLFYGNGLQAILQNTAQIRIPAWFNEGLAEFAAQGWDTESDMYVREAILGGHLANIGNLRGFYAYRGGQGVWDYIAAQYGPEKIGEIMQRFRVTRSVEASFIDAMGLSVAQLSERWHRALQEIYFPEVAAREPIEDIGKAVITRSHSIFNSSPAISPLGDKLVFVSVENGLFNIYLASASDGKIIRRLVEGQRSSQFESLRILTPGLTWHPDGTHIAAAVKNGASQSIAIINVQNGKARHIVLEELDEVISVSWSPDGSRIALEGTNGAHSDLYLLDLESESLVNLTDDVFSDHEPYWSPDGQTLVFHSDRGAFTSLRSTSPETFQLIRHGTHQVDLFTLRIGASEATRITRDEIWDEKSARFGPDGKKLIFISDRNGIYNLYEHDLESGAERPLTDLLIGVTQLSLSADGQRAAVVSLRRGVSSIYVLRRPFMLGQRAGELRPSVWGQRVMQSLGRVPPALALSGDRDEIRNPFLRDATNGIPYARGQDRLARPLLHQPLLAAANLTGRAPVGRMLLRDQNSSGQFALRHSEDSASRDSGEEKVIEGDSPDPDSRRVERSVQNWFNSANFEGSGGQVDFRNYSFSPAFSDAAGVGVSTLTDYSSFRTDEVSLDANGNYVPRKYKLDFSPDIVYGAAGYDPLYGVQGITQVRFSDVLGNHRLLLSTNLLIDLRNADYILSYEYLAQRVDWTISTFHQSRLLADFARPNPTYFRYRQYGVSIEASYPINKFRRIDLELAFIGVNKVDITDITRPAVTRLLLTPRITWTRDVTVPGYLSPRGGSRYAISALGSGLTLSNDPTQFLTVMGDIRVYKGFDREGQFVLALRGSGGASIGPNRQLFYTSGVLNWVNRNFDDINGFPISNVTDFVFATPILPLRGFSINERNGSSFALLNAEFRFPLVRALIPAYIPLLPLYNIHGQVFADVASIPNDDFTEGDAPGSVRFNSRFLPDELLVGTGFGVRTFFLGFPLRVDIAWPFDGNRFGSPKTYVSIGIDF